MFIATFRTGLQQIHFTATTVQQQETQRENWLLLLLLGCMDLIALIKFTSSVENVRQQRRAQEMSRKTRKWKQICSFAAHFTSSANMQCQGRNQFI